MMEKRVRKFVKFKMAFQWLGTPICDCKTFHLSMNVSTFIS